MCISERFTRQPSLSSEHKFTFTLILVVELWEKVTDVSLKHTSILRVKWKGKFVPVLSVRGSGRIALSILDLGTSWRWVVSVTPRPLYSGEGGLGTHWKGDWVSPRTDRHSVENSKLLTLPGLELRPLGRPARSQSLYRLPYPGSYLQGRSSLLPWSWWQHYGA
jgi:hypothetical protein